MTRLIALLPYLRMSAGLLSALALFVSLKLEMLRNERRSRRRIETLTARLAVAERAVIAALDREAPAAFVPRPKSAGFNQSKRVHALRLLRRGENTAHIAAALSMPRQEVELLIRVQSMGRAWDASGGSG